MKYNPGDKVVPISKSIWGSSIEDTPKANLAHSCIWNDSKKIGYLEVIYYNKDENYYSCGIPGDLSKMGDFFLEQDLIPYVAKPPLGIIPRWRWLELREQELKDAIQRYVNYEKEYPQEWENELFYIQSELMIRKLSV